MYRTYRRILSLGVATAALAPLAAQAQDAPPAQPSDTIVITGSRIERDPNVAAPVPVQSVDSEDIRLSGEVQLSEIANELPALFSSQTGSDTLGVVDGGQVLELRGLGPERTLVLVDGRRYVPGVEGTASVDIGSIPSLLVERVEVLTGGASAVYGSDAVTGVVNFILRDRYEGAEFTARGGISGEGDAEQFLVGGIWGKNFADDRGNITVAAEYRKDAGLLAGDRDFSRNNGRADDYPNPALRFQAGELDPTTTPNFFNAFGFGSSIPDDCADFAAGIGANLTPQEQALCDRAANAPTRFIDRQPTFAISSARGVITPGDFGLAPGVDVDGDGVDDCQQSFIGQVFAGCWVVGDNGQIRPFQDGVIASSANQFGGDGIGNTTDDETIVPESDAIVLNVGGSYQLTPKAELFGSVNYAFQEAISRGGVNTFNDLLFVGPDNPFIPLELQDLANQTGGLFVTRDQTDLGLNNDSEKRETLQFVGGVRGDAFFGWNYELTASYGEFERTSIDRNARIEDRWFAAVDATTDAAGNPVCRSSLTGQPPENTSPFPFFDTGFFTFLPDDGSCAPANLFGGVGGLGQEAVDFVTTTLKDRFKLEQTVLAGTLIGDSSEFFELPAGPIDFAVGFEYRDEESTSDFNGLTRGVIPIDLPNGPLNDDPANAVEAGTLAGDVSGNDSLDFDSSIVTENEDGGFDVTEFFAEVSVPLLADQLWTHALVIEGAFRYSDYSTIGGVETWKAGFEYAPTPSLRFRGTLSQAVRAPNIFELFSPAQGTTFRPVDPCEQSEIDALAQSDPERAATRAANCLADGIPAGFEDPLTGRFSGTTGGNPDLIEETADTYTIGFVAEPSFIDGLTVTVDYWDIEIEDAIVAVSAQDTVNQCYDSSDFPNNFCGQFTRDRDPDSGTFLGFNFLNQTQINFGAIESSGIDFAASYDFDAFGVGWSVYGTATYVNEIDFFFNPGDPSDVNPELGEIRRPEWGGRGGVQAQWDALTVSYEVQYQGEQGLRAVEVETADVQYGSAGFVDDTFIHDVVASYDVSDTVTVFGGINNITDEEPFITEFAWPVNPRGRYVFVGATVTL